MASCTIVSAIRDLHETFNLFSQLEKYNTTPRQKKYKAKEVNVLIEIEYSRFFLGFADTAMQFRYDILFTIMLLPVTVGLYILSKNNPNTDIIHSLLAGTIIFSPILIMFTYFYEILPYRFVPTLVFFSIGVAMFFSKKPK